MRSQLKLSDLLDYFPDTGKLFWKVRPASLFSDGKHRREHTAAKWNARYAGKEAFTCDNGKGYRHTNICGVKVLAHRAAWEIFYGSAPPRQIDHVNGDRSDNRIENLRLADGCENGANRGLPANNTSGAKGVTLHKASGLWHATITHKGRKHSLKYHKTVESAKRAVMEASRRLNGEFHKEYN